MAKGDQSAITGNTIKSGLTGVNPGYMNPGTLNSSIGMNAGLNPNAGFGSAPLMPPMGLINAMQNSGQQMPRPFVGPYNQMPTNNAPAIIPQPGAMRQPGGGGINEAGNQNPIGPSDDAIRKLLAMGHNVGQ